VQHGVGQHAHEADARAAVDEADTFGGEPPPEGVRGVGVVISLAGFRAAVDAEPAEVGHGCRKRVILNAGKDRVPARGASGPPAIGYELLRAAQDDKGSGLGSYSPEAIARSGLRGRARAWLRRRTRGRRLWGGRARCA